MSKKNERQKIEQARQGIAKRYKEQLNQLTLENRNLKSINEAGTHAIEQLTKQLEEANNTIKQMQELCNMSDEERTTYLDYVKHRNEVISKVGSLMDITNYLHYKEN